MTKKNMRKMINLILFVSLFSLVIIGVQLANRQLSANNTKTLVVERESLSTQTISENPNLVENAPGTTSSEDSFAEETLEFQKNDQGKYLALNTDYVGWLTIDDTAINYPVVRGDDNAIYLNKDFFGQTSDAGSIFMDYRNLAQFNDQHTVIYGHNMKDGTMFHDLNLYKDSDFYDSHQTIKLQGLYETKTYTVFSAYVESANDYVLDFEYEAQTYVQYLETIKKKSLYESDLTFNGTEEILTLVTCSYEVDNGRTIVHAVEVK